MTKLKDWNWNLSYDNIIKEKIHIKVLKYENFSFPSNEAFMIICFAKYYTNGLRQMDVIIETNTNDHPFFAPYHNTWMG